MRGERQLLRIGEYLIGCACRYLPSGMPGEVRDERYEEWAAELPAILHDPDIRLAAHRAVRMLRYATGTIRGTALSSGHPRRRLTRNIGNVAGMVIFNVPLFYFQGWWKNPLNWLYAGVGWFLGGLLMAVTSFAYRKLRGKSLDDELTETPEVRAQSHAQIRARCILEARTSAGQAISSAARTSDRFPQCRVRPGYRIAEVDAFIARIEATLGGTAGPGQAVTAADVQAVKFKTTRRGGYDEEVMDEVLELYAEKLGSSAPADAAG